ncbi:MAG: F0F1 ATP synthase subunit A [Clostridia bacterium]|nr:F0F1 ATP synthase subunit A [Clostridia bacterium]
MALPIAFSIVLKVLTNPPSEGISISGAKIFLEIPMPLQNFIISESQINSAMVLITIFFFCLYMTHGLSDKIELKRQHFAELIVEKVDGLIKENMGDYFSGYAPFIIAIMALSAFSSLLSLFALYPPTSDINIVGGWAILVFALITYYKLKGGLLNYLKGFTEPIFVMLPLNILGEVATPVSLAFRHYGNVLSGSVIAVLISAALGGVSSMVLSWLPGTLASFPLFQVGIPAVLSIYFDVFSGCMQAFIFAMLTMLNISGGFDMEAFEKRRLKKAQKALKNK